MRISNQDPRLIVDDLGNPLWYFHGLHLQDMADMLNRETGYNALKVQVEELENQASDRDYSDLESEVDSLEAECERLTGIIRDAKSILNED